MFSSLAITGLIAWARHRVTTIAKGHAGTGAAVAVVAFAIIASLWWLRADAAADAVAASDAGWRTRLARRLADNRAAETRIVRAAAEAAARQRRAEAERDDAVARAAELEQALATIKARSGDPVIYPRTLAKELRK